MRKVLAIVLVALMMLSFAACGGEGGDTATTTTVTTTAGETVTTTVGDVEDNTTTTVEVADDVTTTEGENETTTTVKQEENKPTSTTTVANTGCKHESASKASCLEAGKCNDCGAEVKPALGHYFYKGACVRCKIPDSSAVQVKSIKFNKDSVDLTQGEMVTLKATVTPDNADKTLTWTSSNPAVATVDANGAVTGEAKGEAVITATAANGVKATCKVSVKEVALEKITYPVVLRYPADHNKSAFEFSIDEVTYEFNNGKLKLSFKGGISYSSGDSTPTTPSFGWRLYSGSGPLVAEGTWEADHAESVAGQYAGVIEGLSDIALGRYNLEFYSTYSSK